MKTGSKKTNVRKIGLALGSGSARGWAHIGVLEALADTGIEPDVVCGSSIGSLVGAAYASNQMSMLESWARELTGLDMVKFLDIRLVVGGGFIQGSRLMDFLGRHIRDHAIEDLPKTFAAVATDLSTGREHWFSSGSLLSAVRASIALPGIFTPVKMDDRWLVDGGLVNPVPVSLCRAMGAEVVIAVNLNGDIVGRHLRKKPEDMDEEKETGAEGRLLEKLTGSFRERVSALAPDLLEQMAEAPGLFDVLAGSINIMQDRITRSRMAGDPPDVMLAPRLGHIGLLEFDRAEEAIEAGRECVRRMEQTLKEACKVS